jgi:endonuclease I
MLLDWNELDPVSEAEIVRNDKIEVIQGNRNPFIDYPELADQIW